MGVSAKYNGDIPFTRTTPSYRVLTTPRRKRIYPTTCRLSPSRILQTAPLTSPTPQNGSGVSPGPVRARGARQDDPCKIRISRPRDRPSAADERAAERSARPPPADDTRMRRPRTRNAPRRSPTTPHVPAPTLTARRVVDYRLPLAGTLRLSQHHLQRRRSRFSRRARASCESRPLARYYVNG